MNLDKIMWFHKKGRLILEPGEVLDMKKMKDLGLVTGSIKHGVKVLADGKQYFNLPIKIEATRASKEAIRAIESAGGEFTARYFNKLGLRAHLSPEWFLNNRGRLPLQARPTKRKDIDYYSRPEKRGYLVKENHPLLQQIQGAKTGGHDGLFKRSTKKSALETQLAALEKTSGPAVAESKVVTLQELKD